MDFGFLGELFRNLGKLGSQILGGNSGLLGGSMGQPEGFGSGFARGKKAVESGGTVISNGNAIQENTADGGLGRTTRAPTNWFSEEEFNKDNAVPVEDQIEFNKRWNERQNWTDAQWEKDINPPSRQDQHNPQSSAGFVDGDINNPALYQPGDRVSTPYPYRRDIPAIDMATKKTIWNGGIGKFNDSDGNPLPTRDDFGYYGPGVEIERGPLQKVLEPAKVPQAQIGMQGMKAPGLPNNPSDGNVPTPGVPESPGAKATPIISGDLPGSKYLDKASIVRMAQIESGGRANAVSPTGAKGLFQFTGHTWRDIGMKGDRMDPAASTEGAIKLANRNGSILENKLGRTPTPTEIYIAHNIGPGGAMKLLTADPDQKISSDLIGSNPRHNPLFFMKGRETVTVGEALERYYKKFTGDGKRLLNF